jgi:hypothetical protein
MQNKAKIFIGPESSGKSRIVKEIASKFKNPLWIDGRKGSSTGIIRHSESLRWNIETRLDETHDLLIVDDINCDTYYLHCLIASDGMYINPMQQQRRFIPRPDVILILDHGLQPHDWAGGHRRVDIYDLSKTPYEELHSQLDQIAQFVRIFSSH